MKYSSQLNRLVLFTISIILSNSICAYSLRQYSSKNGLSNSAILSMYQDKEGLMWFGSCEGLNMFDGLRFQVFMPSNEENILSGNIIESILEAEDNTLWIQTNYGLDRLDKQLKTVRTFKEFKGKNWVIKNTANDIFVVKNDNYLYYYVAKENKFHNIYIENLVFDDILQIVIDKGNTLWIFMKNGKYFSYGVHLDENKELTLTKKNYFTNKENIIWCFYEDGIFYFVDDTYALYEFDPISKNKYYIHDISAEVVKYGDISSIIKYKDNYFIGFKNSGLIILQHMPEQKKRFSIYEVDIKSGIFCLMKDKYQDIVWVGTDGQGVYMYYTDSYTIKATLFRDLPHNINNPIRTFFLDDKNTLWVGTKGDGILSLGGYDIATSSQATSAQFQTINSQLKDNSVYTIVPSKKNILWIGSEKGINYYSYKDKKIKNIDVSIDGKPVQYVHSICEFNDSTLWIATVGEGIVKARLGGDNDNPVISNEKLFLFDEGKFSSNYFFTTYKENDSVIWFGNRGYGAYRINNYTEDIETFTFDQNDRNQTLNDIFSILKNKDGYWFGTSYGLARMYDDGKKQTFDKENGFPNNAIHGILQDYYNNLWLSTNQGLIKFNIAQNTFQTYRQHNELEVTEFSDGAYFKHENTGVLFFGGINGFITIIANELAKEDYSPPIQFNGLSIFGKENNIFDFLEINNEDKTLKLNYRQNFFSVSFTAVDYIHGNDYTYFYKLDELSTDWIDNGTSNTAAFTNISPGKYTLLVKYRNNITGKESPVQSLFIDILPPWYLTNMAYLVYAILSLFILFIIIRFSIKWYKMKKDNIIERLNRQQREEIYESKLRFFTNITHELCTPLTLIYGPCEKILSYKNTDNYINKYATLIQHNAEKLNGLISELIEFRRLETGNKTLEIRNLSVSELTRNIADSFTELAEAKGFEYEVSIEENVLWNTDPGCLSKVVTNLISNAFKYTSDNGKIGFELFVKGGKLNIAVSNTGKGIKKEDIAKIFDRYTILDNFEGLNKNKVSPRNGLGLAICHNMVKLLEGEINVSSTPNEVTVFTVTLPVVEVTDDSPVYDSTELSLIEETLPVNPENSPIPDDYILPGYDKEKKTIMIVDDDPSMLWFVTEIFIEQYNVIPINDAKEVIPCLKKSLPDLIISDIMMPDIDGLSLTASIKADKLQNHIPLILLSAKNTEEDQIRGIDSGAEVYITKPFNVKYLEKVVERLIKRKEDLQQYFSSALSSFEVSEGKLTHEEDRRFMEKVYEIIETNIANPDLSVDTISSSLGYSTRQFYRRLKDITPKKTVDIIKEYKLDVVKRLLISTNLSVDEIMDKTGFVNRGNFFKIFFQKFETTPKKYREEVRKNAGKSTDAPL
ncbi:MAG: response regulator [Prevotella sp.]|nr:response regulator [Prevotella sp.]